MICPTCGTRNVPGVDLCKWCLLDLSAIDRPTPFDRIDGSLMGDCVAVLEPNPPICVPETGTLGGAVAAMISKRVGAVLVTDERGKLVGILTERDFLTRVAGRSDFASQPVRHYMTRDPETVTTTDPLAFVLAKMDVGGYRHLPVVQDGVPVGVVSVRDVLRHFMNVSKHEN